MASKRAIRRRNERIAEERRKRQCSDKKRYTDEALAEKEARIIGLKRGVPLVHYKCPWCSKNGEIGFHVGHAIGSRSTEPSASRGG